MKCYYAFILKDKKNGYAVFFPDFPEASTQGDSIEECFEMGEDALNIAIEEYMRERREIPVPSDFETVKKLAEKEALENADLTDLSFAPLIQIFKAPEVSQKPVKLTVSFPKYALDTIDMKADKMGMTRSGFLVKAALAFEA